MSAVRKPLIHSAPKSATRTAARADAHARIEKERRLGATLIRLGKLMMKRSRKLSNCSGKPTRHSPKPRRSSAC